MIKCKCGTYRRYGDEIAGRRVAPAMNLDACCNCGYVPTQKVNTKVTDVKLPQTDSKKRLGDVVADTLGAVGGDKVAKVIEKVTGKDCGCNRRRKLLNNLDRKIRG
jgi:hypothetical protein